MSRRDTIIIALLVNTSLLALLFMLAVNTDEESVADQPEIVKTIVESPQMIASAASQPPIVLADTHVNDEVDSFLKDLAAEDSSQQLVIDDEGYVELKRETPMVLNSTPAPVVQQVDGEKYVEVTVKRGDALEKIARSNGTTVEVIKKINNLTSAKLSIGQVLRVPVTKKSVSEKGSAETSVSAKSKPSQPIAANTNTSTKPKDTDKKVVGSSDVQYYTVKSGDNPWKIAKQFNVRFEDLLKLNNLDEERARNLKIGDKVRVK